ncbi:MAG: hypothetical protein K2Y32_00215 [Candidatus Obscuribacterales bacterium]|nr:hypothetical protein [Candidatus Obscuribacterales bacterium]
MNCYDRYKDLTPAIVQDMREWILECVTGDLALDEETEVIEALQAVSAPSCAHKRVKLIAGQGCTCRDCGASV